MNAETTATAVGGAQRLRNVVRDYAWGSATAIPELLGEPVTGEPAAEMWMGAHPASPSVLAEHPDRLGLDALIATDPERYLGRPVADRFGGTLPFLMKVLAAEQPVSLQAHPSLAQAREGFARENSAGIALDAFERSYKDANHKPEQIVALTAFDGLCGFRPVERTARLLDRLDVHSLGRLRARLVAAGGLRDVVTGLLTAPSDHIAELLADLVPAARRVADAGGEWAAEARWIMTLAEGHPGDRGVVMAMLLNLVRLSPGESMFLGAGQIHFYLHGTGIEVMANSDNVLRGGLTAKHVDVPELIRVLVLQEQLIEPVAPSVESPGVFRYPSSVPDFVLRRIEPRHPVASPAGGPRIVLCVAGRASVQVEGTPSPLRRGESAFLPASASAELSGPDATLFVAAANV